MLCELVDEMSCYLVFIMGGIGLVCCDVMFDVMLVVVDCEMFGFGEQMCQISLYFVLIVIFLCQVGVICKQVLIFNLFGQLKFIKEMLEGVKDVEGNVVVYGIFVSVLYCIQLLEGLYVEMVLEVVAVFRLKSVRCDVSE